MSQEFRVRIYVNGSAPMVVKGGTWPFGTYIQTRDPSGEGRSATPSKRITIDPALLRALPAGGDADYELTVPVPANKL